MPFVVLVIVHFVMHISFPVWAWALALLLSL